MSNNVQTVTGTLESCVKQLIPGTIQSAEQITAQRVSDQSLRNDCFWTSDLAVYRVENGRVILYLCAGKDNLLFKSIEIACHAIKGMGAYFVLDRQDIDKLVNSENTLRIDTASLSLSRPERSYCYFSIDTRKPTLVGAQRLLAQRVYGSDKAFDSAMQSFRSNSPGIVSTNIYVLNSDYVKRRILGDYAICLPCLLGGFTPYVSKFDVGYEYVGGDGNRMCGVKKRVSLELVDAYDTIMENSDDLPQDMIEGLSKLARRG